MSVSDFMIKNLRTIKENEPVGQVCKLMYQDNIGSIVILGKDTGADKAKTPGKIPVGIVTERDIARMVGF